MAKAKLRKQTKAQRRQQSTWSLAIRSLLSLGLAYAFASLAIDRGNLWYYLLAILFLVRGIVTLVLFIKKR